MVKSLPGMQETQVSSWVWKISWGRKWQPAPVFLPGESYGQKSLVSPRLWGQKESDTTEQLTHTNAVFISFTVFFINTLSVKGLPWWLRW